MLYYQVQVQKLDKSWEALGASFETRAEAQRRMLEYFMGHYDWVGVFVAIRLASVWLRSDKVWTIKEILEYRDIKQSK